MIKFEGLNTITYLDCEDYTINLAEYATCPISIYNNSVGLTTSNVSKDLGLTLFWCYWQTKEECDRYTKQEVLHYLNFVTVKLTEGFLK